jgi:hypothetical protein
MTTDYSVGAASNTKVNRPTIDWQHVHRNVRRLQMRSVKATQNYGEAASQEGRWKGLSGIWRKVIRVVLRGGGDSNAASLPDIFIISMLRQLAERSRGICVSLVPNTSPTLVRRAG